MYLRRLTMERLLPISLLLSGFLVPACSTEPWPTDPLEPASLTGEIVGLVTGDGAPLSAVTVTLSRSGAEVATVMTTGNGEFGFRGLDAGTYTVTISEIAGMNCTRLRAATVVAGEETAVSFACVTPAPVGTVEGRVTVNGVGAGGVFVSIDDASGRIASKFTAKDGTYRFTNVPTGAKTVWIGTQEPCPGTQEENGRREQEVTVSEEAGVVADFACTGQVITGTVTVNGISVSGWTVLVCIGSAWDFCESTATDSEGRYAYTSLRWNGYFPPGDYFMFVQSPSGTTCPQRPSVLVPSGVAVTVDFACSSG